MKTSAKSDIQTDYGWLDRKIQAKVRNGTIIQYGFSCAAGREIILSEYPEATKCCRVLN